MVDPSPSSSATYQWDTMQCYTHPNHNGGSPSCFPHDQETQSVTDNSVTAEDAGTITCTVTVSGNDFTSEPFTLRTSGEQLVYCVMYYVLFMLLLLATCYCCTITVISVNITN